MIVQAFGLFALGRVAFILSTRSSGNTGCGYKHTANWRSPLLHWPCTLTRRLAAFDSTIINSTLCQTQLEVYFWVHSKCHVSIS